MDDSNTRRGRQQHETRPTKHETITREARDVAEVNPRPCKREHQKWPWEKREIAEGNTRYGGGKHEERPREIREHAKEDPTGGDPLVSRKMIADSPLTHDMASDSLQVLSLWQVV